MSHDRRGPPTSGTRRPPLVSRVNSPVARLHLPADVRRAVERHADGRRGRRRSAGCSSAARSDGARQIESAEPLANVAAAEVRPHYFALDPLALMRAERAADAAGRRVLGIYHSHPNGVCRPSETDRREAWPWYSYLIVAPEGDGWTAGSWRLADGRMVPERLTTA